MTSDTRSGGADPPDAPQESVPAGTTDRIVELREEVDQLTEAVTSHATVDQAIGMMVALGRVSPDQGWAVLQEVSQHTNVKLRAIAEMILVWGRQGDLPPEIRAVLEETLDKYGPTQIPGGSPAP
ncbi:ANTAR domain-containing protein [Streptomyces sp. NBC_01450]|uniref:ANTAR domain-containing protein n=1 Tax=Streptomyces sp. NBC_01450 TaxID=2903871 RepID=UPI002E2EACAC|nr:ANTAR domain-containing protein [Streptomyces sp. NBC_01450]